MSAVAPVRAGAGAAPSGGGASGARAARRLHVAARVNGEPVEFLCDPEQSLLEALRDELGLTGAKEGCATGDCGACTVTLDGALACSCLVLAAEVEGRDVGTVEGLACGPGATGADRGAPRLSRLQRKFLEDAALQCGVCTPGFLVAAQALLDRRPDPSEREVRTWLSGNLCRCTGYDKIVRAVLDAAAELREGRA
jgi:carbon-monoxide dehydrogenase small subunit